MKHVDNPGMLPGPIVASSGEEPHPVAVAAGNEPVAVVLDFMDPFPTAGSLLAGAGEAGRYETRTRNTHGGPIEATRRAGKDDSPAPGVALA